MEGVTGVNDFGREGNRDGKQFGVHLYTRKAGEDRKMKRVACGADIPTKVDAAIAAKEYVAGVLGAAALEAAEECVRAEYTHACTEIAGMFQFQCQNSDHRILGEYMRLERFSEVSPLYKF